MNHDGLGKPVCVCVCVSGAVKIRINILNRMFLSLNRRIQDTFFFSLFTYDTNTIVSYDILEKWE